MSEIATKALVLCSQVDLLFTPEMYCRSSTHRGSAGKLTSRAAIEASDSQPGAERPTLRAEPRTGRVKRCHGQQLKE